MRLNFQEQSELKIQSRIDPAYMAGSLGYTSQPVVWFPAACGVIIYCIIPFHTS
jgi:hypothetical protein